MNELMKIREVSLQYGVSVRTLRYYEDMGLLSSIRQDDYAYRVYDEEALRRLEQILILRKLDISIRDIKTVFKNYDTKILIDILQKKVDDIDDEAAQLHILKKIVADFINQIKNYSFSEDADIKLLYERISELEEKVNTIENNSAEDSSDFDGQNKVTLSDLTRISVPDVRVLLLPACKMVSSGYGFFGEENFDRFDRWFSAMKKVTDWEMPQDFAWFDPEKGAMVWWFVKPNYDVNTQDFEIVDFDGGMYAAAVSRDGDDEDGNRVHAGIKRWIEESGTLELDERPGHYTMFHVITDNFVKEALGFHQLEILVPVKKIEK